MESHVKQNEYNPFESLDTPIFQEFGEVISEGMYAMFDKKLLNERFNPEAWQVIIKNRKYEIEELMSLSNCKIHKDLIEKSNERINEIKSGDCSSYIRSIEKDNQKWISLLKRTRNEHYKTLKN